jgi:hypothetical protein
MIDHNIPPPEDLLTAIDVEFEGVNDEFPDFTIQEVFLGESLLTPGLQTSIVAQSYIHNSPYKNFDVLKNKLVSIKLDRPSLYRFGLPSTMDVKQTIYRLENRKMVNRSVEEMTFRACDVTLLNDAETLVSKSWKCTSPSTIAEYVLRSCAGVKNLEVETSAPNRDYIAENIHPFQVVQQQASVALANGNDPSFIHYMTYENLGTHHFKSLYNLTKQKPVMEYYHVESAVGYANPYGIMTYSFPCDFDLLSDVLNGIDRNGRPINSVAVFNPRDKTFSLLGDQTIGCGIGSGVFKMALSNLNSAKDQNSCDNGAIKYLPLRQARMNLLEKDKIALRLTVPWNPILNGGKVIRLKLLNREDPDKGEVYGSGDYLILHMYHNIKRGGFATTTMDCVARTVGSGEV